MQKRSGSCANRLEYTPRAIVFHDGAIRADASAAQVLNDPELNEQQKTYLQQIVAYAQANGDITPKTLLNESPFNSIGVVELFGAEKFPVVKETLNTLHKPLSE